MTSVVAYYYDGNSSKRHSVRLLPVHDGLALEGDGIVREVPFAAMRISDKLGSSPRLVYFADGGHCEVLDQRNFESVLHEAGMQPVSWVARLESSWRHALGALLLCIACGIAGYIWGLPWLAKVIAERIPYATAHIIDVQTMQTLDKGILQPSRIPLARRQALQREFDGICREYGLPALPIQFRSSKPVGANAFALPGGTVVVTDQLVQLADNDEEVLGVLAHELGHVREHHSMRNLLQGSAVGLFMTWYVGDISSLLAAAPTLLLQASYSRDFETRADRFAADTLHRNGIPPSRLADMLKKLEQSQHESSRHEGFEQLLASHPDTEKRIRALNEYEHHPD